MLDSCETKLTFLLLLFFVVSAAEVEQARKAYEDQDKEMAQEIESRMQNMLAKRKLLAEREAEGKRKIQELRLMIKADTGSTVEAVEAILADVSQNPLPRKKLNNIWRENVSNNCF